MLPSAAITYLACAVLLERSFLEEPLGRLSHFRPLGEVLGIVIWTERAAPADEHRVVLDLG